MADQPGERRPPSTLKGRLADVFVPALVDGELEALARRLGTRATLDDPLYGRASTLPTIEPVLAKMSAEFRERAATYRHRASTTGVTRDAVEGLLTMSIAGETRDVPIVVVAERRRLRDIELRLYYDVPDARASRPARAPLALAPGIVALPQLVAHVFEAIRKGAVERVLAAFEESSKIVDPRGRAHGKRDGRMAAFVTDLGFGVELVAAGTADDGRTCAVEGMLAADGRDAVPALLVFERGETGLLRELRLYFD